VYEDPQFQINSDGNRPEGLVRKEEEKEEEPSKTFLNGIARAQDSYFSRIEQRIRY
jgi:hypothetical protein